MKKILILLFLVLLLPAVSLRADTGKCETMNYKGTRVHRCDAALPVYFREGTWQEAVNRGIVQHREYEKIRFFQNLLNETGIVIKRK